MSVVVGINQGYDGHDPASKETKKLTKYEEDLATMLSAFSVLARSKRIGVVTPAVLLYNRKEDLKSILLKPTYSSLHLPLVVLPHGVTRTAGKYTTRYH